MKNILLIFLIFSGFTSLAQNNKNLKAKYYGFIKTDYWVDSRQVIYAREGLFTLFPKDRVFDKNGKDINASKNFNFSAITSRAGVDFSGLKSFNADVQAKLEADFSGMSNQDINGFRLRHALIKLNWEDDNLLLGQYWHPMFVTDAFPRVISLNTGAPFQSFNRSPQLRFTRYVKKLHVIFAAIAQRDYASIGPEGRDFKYLSNSYYPNIHLQLKMNRENHIYGIAADAKSLRPQLVSDSGYINNNKVQSLSFMAYYLYKSEKFNLRLKSTYGQNLADQLMLGGYAVHEIDTLSGIQSYTPTNHIFAYLNMDYKVKTKKGRFVKFGIFGGYANNLGTSEENTGIYYSTGSDIRSMYRVSPSISLISGSTQVCIEYEFTSVDFGTPDVNGIVDNLHTINNSRFLFTGFYFF